MKLGAQVTAEEVDEIAGEIEVHRFELELSDIAEKYLDVEFYFRHGPLTDDGVGGGV
jgi:hypothetical protein